MCEPMQKNMSIAVSPVAMGQKRHEGIGVSLLLDLKISETNACSIEEHTHIRLLKTLSLLNSEYVSRCCNIWIWKVEMILQ